MEQTNKKHIGLWIGIIFGLLVIGIIIYVVLTYTNNQNETKKRMGKVEELYGTFKSNVDTFNTKRNEIYTIIMQDMYYQTLKDKDGEFKKLYQDYQEILEKLDEDYDGLKGKCINVLYPDVSINNKCEAFVLGYEEVVNTYINDVNLYNKNLESYNDWLKETNSKDTELNLLELDRDYIDVNGDRIFKGKEQEDEVGELTDEKK